MSKSKSSHEWLRAHEQDEFVKRARAEGYRSRAAYKLIEMADKYNLLKPGMCIVDLGAAPGGWSQVAARRASGGNVIALDVLDMAPVTGVTVLKGDFTTEETLQRLVEAVGASVVDLVLSDMAPNLSGMKAIDQPRSAHLVELAIDLADRVLRRGGTLVVKCFEGEGIDSIRSAVKERFDKVSNFKPRSSRGKSREIYIIGQAHKQEPSV